MRAQIRNPKFQQTALELVFPILGYFFWDWTLLIIVVFYLLDYLASQIMFVRRMVFVQRFSSSTNLMALIVSSLWFLIVFTLCVFVIWFRFINGTWGGESELIQEMLVFAKSELWFLFPVIVLSYYLQDKIFFFIPRKFTQINAKSYAIKNGMANAGVLVLVGVSVFVSTQVVLHDIIILFSIIMAKLGFDFLLKKTGLKF